jgi:UDP-N-acetylglucosamine--N-acetylmuramyl-(pentapeptide) pyrophosphoryl-undecaprenol N-acetylglucosamine transferase
MARLIFVPFEESKKHFARSEKLIVSGNPVRGVFAEAKAKTKNGAGFTILSFGGSLGSQRINNVMLSCFQKMLADDVRFIIITGARDWDNVEKIAAGMAEKMKFPESKLKIIPYANDIIEWYDEADIVVSRSGALTLSELIALEKPAILIPSPNVVANHQFHNAKVLSDDRAAILIDESNLSADLLHAKIRGLLNSPERLGEMRRNIAKFKKEDSAEIICSAILKDVGR